MSAHPDKVRELLDAFEEVFDRDWAYTKEMLGIRDETPEDKAEAAKLGLETIAIIAEDGTFVNPKVEDEASDWGRRARLLAAYRALGGICHDAEQDAAGNAGMAHSFHSHTRGPASLS
jgi:hypothetical protein